MAYRSNNSQPGNQTFTTSVSGATQTLTVSNTSNTASSSANILSQVAGSTAADATYQATISGGQNWTWGLDNSDSDAFVVAASSALGTTNVMRVSSAGEINYPLQPCFLAYISASVSNVTGDGTNYTIVWNAEIFDQNSDFNTGTGTFTAPVTGRYYFQTGALFNDVTTSFTGSEIQIVTSNRTLKSNENCGKVFNSSSQYQQKCFAIVDMDAADTATVIAVVSGSTKTIDINQGGSTDLRTWFAGNLIC